MLVAGIAAAGALLALAFLAAGRLGLLSETAAATIVVLLAVGIGVACCFRFGSGPRALWRDRLIVIAPVFLVAAPAIVAVHDLGGGAGRGDPVRRRRLSRRGAARRRLGVAARLTGERLAYPSPP